MEKIDIARKILEGTRQFFLTDEATIKAARKWTCSVTYVFPDVNKSLSMQINKGIPSEISEGGMEPKPGLVFTMTIQTLMKMVTQELDPRDAYKKGEIREEGKLQDKLTWMKVNKPAEVTLKKMGPVSSDGKKRINEMIRSDRKLQLKNAAELLGYTPNQVLLIICDLIVEGKIKGTFEGDVFLIESEVEDFIRTLDASFADWENKAKTLKDKKI